MPLNLGRLPVTIPVRLQFGDGTPEHLGDVTGEVTSVRDGDAVRLELAASDRGTLAAQIAELLEHAARKVREGADDAATRPGQ